MPERALGLLIYVLIAVITFALAVELFDRIS